MGQHGELSQWADRLGVSVRPALKALRREQPARPEPPAMAVNLDACIQCNRCVRACREEQVNDVIGYALRGADSKIVSTSTTPWPKAPAWPAANACRPAPRARSAPRRTSAPQVDRKVDFGLPVLRCGLPHHLERAR